METLEQRRLLAAIEVTTGLDIVDSGDGLISLREAIDQANVDSEIDTITFRSDVTTVTLTKTTGDDIANNNVNGDLDLSNGEIIIQGNGRGDTVITAGGDTGLGERVFHVLGGAVVSIKDLTIQGGRDVLGAGISSAGNAAGMLTLENVLLTDNVSTGDGGAIAVSTESTTRVVGSTISGNSSSLSGGAIASFGMLSVESSTIAGNTAGNLGGGVHVQGDTGHANIDDSTISGNTAANGGGGISNFNATIEVNDSTISGNSTSALAGALLNVSDGTGNEANSSLVNATIALNQSGGSASVHTFTQTGATAARVEFGNSIFVANTGVSSAVTISASAAGTLTSLGNNVLDDSGFGSLLGSDVGSVDNEATPVIDVMLADNGGPTRTHALIDDPANPAVDGGNDALAAGSAFDQRQAPFLRKVGVAVDVGAIELLSFDADAFVVTSTGDGDPDFFDDAVTLREAVLAANVKSGPQEITFARSLTQSGPAVLRMEGPEFSIIEDLAISGPGSHLLTINGNDQSRLFKVDDGDSANEINVTLSGMTLTGGLAGNGTQDNGANAGKGGAVLSTEQLNIRDSVVTNSEASLVGGGIFSSGPLSIQNSTVTGNTAQVDGGGIQSDGSIVLVDSTISENATGGSGGGLKSTGATSIIGSTFEGNTAGGFGGGVWTGGMATISNSTLSNNNADQSGGGIRVDINRLTVTNSTIVRNRSDADGNGSGVGGGIATFDDALTMTTLVNTIVAGNLTGAPGSDGPSDLGEKNVEESSRNNLLGDPDSAGGLVHDADGDLGSGDNHIVGQSDGNGGRELIALNVVVGPLSLHGGTTETHALVSGSPAIDAGDSTVSESQDQRGVPFQRNDGGGVDIGAYETQRLASTTFEVTTLEDIVDPSDGEVSLREAIGWARGSAGAEEIRFASNLTSTAPATITLTRGELAIRDDLMIAGPGADRLTIDADGRSRIFLVDDGDSGSNADVEIAGLTLTGGRSEAGNGATSGSGGAIYSVENLSVRASTLSGNTVIGTDSGGGIFAGGDGTLRIIDSTIAGNTAYSGGGLINDAGGGVVISNSTISGNTATTYAGGGIFNQDDLTITNSTITDNVTAGAGGGLMTRFANTVTIENTILFGNRNQNSTPIDLQGTSSMLQVQSSVLGEVVGFTLVDGENNNHVGVIDAGLGPLASNGGPTLTHALLAGSLAIDAGSTGLAPSGDFDQRGTTFMRVADGNGDGSAVVDIGAYESQRLANQPPSFTAADPDPIFEDAGAQSISSFATFDAGHPSESGQTVLAYRVFNVSHPDLFETPPQIDTAGMLTFTPAADAFGTSTFDVTVQDDGGTVDGGVDVSEVQRFVIAINGVNDPPTFTIGEPVVVDEDSGEVTVSDFASAFDPGSGESGVSDASRLIQDEGVDGTTNPFSTDHNSPTDVGSLSLGSNIVRGFVDAANSVGDVDVFTFQIDPGFQLDGIFVNDYAYITPPSSSNERNAFLAIDDENTFPYNANELTVGVDESLFIGGTVFGLDDLPAEGGGNILPRAGFIAGSGFTPPLQSGTYTFYIQQTGPANTYELDLRVGRIVQQKALAYTISNVSDASLFSTQPTIDTDGNLTFTPADDVSGIVTFEVVVQDNGGTDDGGVDTSTTQIGTITINSVNDRPIFEATDPDRVFENAGMQTVTSFATGFDPGPEDEDDQTLVSYQVSNVSNPGLFAEGPLVDSTGTLRYTPATNTVGMSTFDLTVQDSGGIANGGEDTSVVRSFTIHVDPFLSEDFGDAPGRYPVLLADDGARHTVGGPRLGTQVDLETDGQPTDSADGDGEDEDGIGMIASIVAVRATSTTSSVFVTASDDGMLDAWIDFNRDGDWNDAGEQIANRLAVSAGGNALSFSIPLNALPGETAARFRLSTDGGLSPTGAAQDGEVEDYVVTIIDGDLSTDAIVNLIGGTSTISQDNGQTVVQTNPVLFSAPTDKIGALDVRGAPMDDFVVLDFGGGMVIPAGGLLLDGGDGSNSLGVIGDDSTLDFTSDELSVQNFASIDLGDDHVNVITVDAMSIASLAPATKEVTVTGGEGDEILFSDTDDWRMGQTSIVDGRFRRTVVNIAGGSESLVTELPNAWQNAVKNGDVNNSGDVTAGDALLIINELSRRAFSNPDSQDLDDPVTVAQWPDTYYDQNGDDRATALDALRVINELARIPLEGESEVATYPAVDLLFGGPEWPSAIESFARVDATLIDAAGDKVSLFRVQQAESSSSGNADAKFSWAGTDTLESERAVDALLTELAFERFTL